MDTHPSPDRLLAFCAGELGHEESAQVEAHLDGCAVCSQEVEHLLAFERVVSKHLPKESNCPPRLSSRLDEQTRVQLARRPRRWLVPLLASAALFLAVLVLALNRDAGSFDAVIHVTDPGGIERGNSPRRVHFDLTLPKPRAVAVLCVTASGVKRVYPHPNPALGLLGMPAILPSGRAQRLPGDELVDFEVPRAGKSSFLVVNSETSFDAVSLAALDALGRTAFERTPDADAVAAAVRARWPEVVLRVAAN